MVPKTAKNVFVFHQNYWRWFGDNWFPAGLSTTSDQKQQLLSTFMLTKFSRDPNELTMLPRVGNKCKRRNAAGWEAFWMTDIEMKDLVEAVMTGYRWAKEGHAESWNMSFG